MMTPAVMTPRRMVGMAYRFGNPQRDATSAPVHAPVPGSGTATNAKSPRQTPKVTRIFFFSSGRSSIASDVSAIPGATSPSQPVGCVAI